ncbi:hypothetical protein DICVIV_12337 [Dictyocaulus viviparus]|uniref:Death domain protein n=1 Tax=Dictyocaulus viviparus TaxID=29172 RepID=A0A0D8XAS3_DICVI|nr:hypothetical protein DICVIV_12337 [Dictyocaulus viviparus]
MSSYIKTVDENAPAHTLPYETMRDLSRVLDAGDTWIELATRMPDITTQDVEGCRQFNSTHRGSPSEYLLRIWASKGFSILSLYNLFAITRMVRCMRIIHHLLPECHHYLEDYNFSVDTWDPCYLNFNEKQSQWRHVSPKVQKNEYVENASPLDSIGSCSRSWVESPTSEPTSAGIVSDPIWSVLQSTLTVPYTDLQEATSNFSDENVIGRGGYGVVYVGEWKHTKIAVKRFMTSGTKCGQVGFSMQPQTVAKKNICFTVYKLIQVYCFFIVV